MVIIKPKWRLGRSLRGLSRRLPWNLEGTSPRWQHYATGTSLVGWHYCALLSIRNHSWSLMSTNIHECSRICSCVPMNAHEWSLMLTRAHSLFRTPKALHLFFCPVHPFILSAFNEISTSTCIMRRISRLAADVGSDRLGRYSNATSRIPRQGDRGKLTNNAHYVPFLELVNYSGRRNVRGRRFVGDCTSARRPGKKHATKSQDTAEPSFRILICRLFSCATGILGTNQAQIEAVNGKRTGRMYKTCAVY